MHLVVMRAGLLFAFDCDFAVLLPVVLCSTGRALQLVQLSVLGDAALVESVSNGVPRVV